MSLTFGTLIAGCATTGNADTQSITIRTLGVQGATCVLSSPAMGRRTVVTPVTLDLKQRQDSIAVRCSKECFEDGTAMIASSLLGGYPAETQITMAPTKGCRPRA